MSAGLNPSPCKTLWVCSSLAPVPHEGQLVIGLAQTVNQARVGIAFVIRALRDFFRNPVNLSFQLLIDSKGTLCFFQYRGFLVVLHFLSEVANAVLLWSVNVAFTGVLHTGYDLQQGGFACAVASNESNPVFASYSKEMFSNRVRSPK